MTKKLEKVSDSERKSDIIEDVENKKFAET